MADIEQLVGLPSTPCDGKMATSITHKSANSSSLQTTRRRNRVRGRKGPPPHVLENKDLSKACEALPSNYKFEIHKTVWRAMGEPRVGLQIPEGLLMYACVISDILEQFASTEVVVLGDVTYGACCVDDLGAKSLGCTLLVHYGHSCLVPNTETVIKCLYIFVEIAIDTQHMVECVQATIPKSNRVAISGTIQFASGVAEARNMLSQHFSRAEVPQEKPLSPGEVLGCTSPKIGDDIDVLIFIADGRFHLESAMIQNPHLQFLRYDPYGKTLTRESYNVIEMRKLRRAAIDKAESACTFGVILGTLGRQGSTAILDRVTALLNSHGRQYFVLLQSELFPARLAAIPQADAWVQIACPRLSIDWGHFFTKPILTPYELEVCLGTTKWEARYPMDFYAERGGAWSNIYHRKLQQPCQRKMIKPNIGAT